MTIQHPANVENRGLFVVVALCVCVVMQMLGVPVTLLNAADIPDELAGSVLEGFSVPPTLPQLAVSSESTLVPERYPFMYVPAFTSAPFHPPVR
ncbi:MAG: hypothetical protein ACT4OL_07265 [Nitrospiraceae bacterium]